MPNPKPGFYRVDLVRERHEPFSYFTSQHLDGPPPPAAEDWPRPRKFAGPLVRVRVLKSIASAAYSFSAGQVVLVAEELAQELGGNARLARDDEALTNAVTA